MLFRFILTKTEYFYREKPLHLNAVVQKPISTNYQGGQMSVGKNIAIPRLHLLCPTF